MGNLPSNLRNRLRHRTRRPTMEDDTGSSPSSPSEEEESDVTVTETGDSSMDFASILSFLLRSGQVRLVRSGGLGAFEIDIRNMGGEDVNETSSDDEFPNRRPARSQSPPIPTGAPDTAKIDQSTLKTNMQHENGFYQRRPTNVASRIMQRQNQTLKRRNHFNRADKTIISSHYLPNSCETMARFRNKVFCGQYSSDGSLFMSACQDQHIRLYDTTGGNFRLFRDITAKEFGWSIVDTAYSPDQHYIIYSSWSEYVHLCNVYGDHDTHLALDLRPRESRFCAFSVSFSQDSKEIIAGGSDQCLYIYDRESDNRILRIDAHDDDVNAVCFGDVTSKILISGGDDGICKVWDRRTLSEDNPKPVGMFAGHTDGITFVKPKGDGTYFLSNSKDQSIKLWDARRFSSENTIKEARRIVANQHWDYRWESIPRRSQRNINMSGSDAIMTYKGHSVLHTLLRAKFSPPHTTGQQYIYTGCATGSVVIYDVLTGEIVKKLKGQHRQCVRDVSWHPYENIIMSSSWDCTIGKWEYYNKTCENESCEAAEKQRLKNEKTRLKRRRISSVNST